MAETVGSHGVAAFTNPSNGDTLDATVVKGNDNTLRSAYVDHDNDPGVHVQSSSLASRPTAGTLGRKWMTTDSGSVKLWYDNGSAWEEVAYVPSTGTATVSALTVTNGATFDTNTLVVDATNNRVGVATTSPTVALDVTGAAKVSNGVTVTAGGLTVNAGGVTVTGNSTITGTLGGLTGVTVTGTVTATTFSGSGASLTNLPAANLTGTLPAISGASLTNLNASNIASGTLDTARLPASITGLTLVEAVTLRGSASSASLTLSNSASQFVTTQSGTNWRVGANGSNVASGNIQGPSGSTTRIATSEEFLIVTTAAGTRYIRLENWS